MAYIKLVDPEDAEGPLARLYKAAIARAGRVYQIIRSMSPNPGVMGASMGMYMQIMMGDSPLSRAQREMMAVVVSKANDCFY